jgi:hypothetical protein
MIEWPSNNSGRLDVTFDKDWQREYATLAVKEVLPADEAFYRTSADFITEAAAINVDGGDGTGMEPPNSWLLSYWMGRYHGDW